jgi:UDP-N-acetyl-D-galactosamine dehydrogenase
VLVLGLTFKENVPDLRNSRSPIWCTRWRLGHAVTVHDPMPMRARRGTNTGWTWWKRWNGNTICPLAVPHQAYLALGEDAIAALVAPGGTLADLKGVLNGKADWKL